MTNNVVAYFSSSLDDNGHFKEYRAVSGSKFSEEYNETLDSGTLVLSQVRKENRLFTIKPYDYVHVVNKKNPAKFSKYYYVDNFDEKENNIKDHLFGYTINLMSETKILEKIQCPNLTITHNIDNGEIQKLTIYEYIRRYMELYVPKIKYCDDDETWHYESLIKMPETTYREASITISFTEDDFTLRAYPSIYYLFDVSSSEITGIIQNAVVVNSVVVTSENANLTGITASFDPNTCKFNVHAEAGFSGRGSGTITINYGYEVSDFFFRFNIPCADLSFNAPTLRQLLTTLMQQVGCIPTVKNRTLSFLDFQKEAVPFGNGDYTLNNTVNFIRRSLSSDSYVNTLVNLSENVLDSENEVICETIGFRDSSNVLLKQQENLKLETSLPIYKVNKLIMNLAGRTTGLLSSSYGCFYGASNYGQSGWDVATESTDSESGKEFPFIIYKNTSVSNHQAKIKFWLASNGYCYLKIDYIYFWGRNLSTGNYYLIERRKFFTDEESEGYGENTFAFGYGSNNPNVNSHDSIQYYDNKDDDIYTIDGDGGSVAIVSYEKVFENLSNDVVGFFFSGQMIRYVNTGTVAPQWEEFAKGFTFIRFADDDPNVVYHDCFEKNEIDIPVLNETTASAGNHIWSSNTDNVTGVPLINRFVAAFKTYNILEVIKWDISKLIVEQSARNLLSRDYLAMQRKTTPGSYDWPAWFNELIYLMGLTAHYNWNLDFISKFVYGTIGYSIGSKEISGFSDVYQIGSVGLGWVQKDYTYIENILNLFDYSDDTEIVRLKSKLVLKHFEGLENARIKSVGNGEYGGPSPLFNSAGVNDLRLMTREGNLYRSKFQHYVTNKEEYQTIMKYYTSLFFDIYYQPLNSFNMSYVKTQEDIDIPLAQYDGNVSGLTDFDRLSIHEQEQVDRVGNETLFISQRTTDFDDIQTFDNGPLVFKDDVNRDGHVTDSDKSVEYIIFKRSFTIENNCFNVSYVGSKDAVLKDYFTSIRTKYRAYQYIDYSQSVLRKEKDLLYVRVSTDYFDGDDKVTFEHLGNTLESLAQRPYMLDFVYDFNNETSDNYEKNVSYEVENAIAKIADEDEDDGYTTEEQCVKNSVSAIATQNTMAFIYEYMDNVGAGTYIQDITDVPQLGGIPQSWQIWDDSYNISHEVSFVSSIGYYDNIDNHIVNPSILPEGGLEEYEEEEIDKIQQSPIVNYEYTTLFSIVDNKHSSNNDTKKKRTFYKDYAERVNHTVQFIYYAPNKDVLFGEEFIAGAPLINRFKKEFNFIYSTGLVGDFYLDENPHNPREGDYELLYKSQSANDPWYSQYLEIVVDPNDPYNIPVKIRVNFYHPNITSLTMAYYDSETQLASDIVVFKNPHPGQAGWCEFFFSLNDTKTDYVMAEVDGILHRRYKVKTYTEPVSEPVNNDLFPRKVEKIYEDEEEEEEED